MKFQFIAGNRSSISVKKMCHVFRVSYSGFYRWRKTPLSPRQIENERLQNRIRELFARRNGMAGSPMITADLQDDQEFSQVSRARVARYMKVMNLKCRTVKKFLVTTDSKHNYPVAPNLVDPNFTATAPGQVWVTDITYLKARTTWCYLTVFIDLFSRIVVVWDLSASLERPSAIQSLNISLLRRRPAQGLMVHSDRGVQYACADFRKVLQQHEIVQSMSRKGNCWEQCWGRVLFPLPKKPAHLSLQISEFGRGGTGSFQLYRSLLQQTEKAFNERIYAPGSL